ncbi:MAG: DUF4266 domain-containing protein [Polyangia bacterium]
MTAGPGSARPAPCAAPASVRAELADLVAGAGAGRPCRRWARGRLARAIVAVAVACGLSGCVVVKPFQREYLAERCMAPGFGDGAELKFRGHWEGSRQGSEGGFGTAGGGCGCN